MAEARLNVVIDPSGSEEGAARVKRNLEDIRRGSRLATDGMDEAGRSFNSVQSVLKNLAAETGVATTQLQALSKSGKFEDLKQATNNLGGLKELKATLSSLQDGYNEAKQGLKAYLDTYGSTGINKTKAQQEVFKSLQKDLDSTGKQLVKLSSSADREMSRTTSAIQKFERQSSVAFNNTIRLVKNLAVTYLSWRGIKSVFNAFISATTEQENATAQLNATLTSTRHAAGLSAEEIGAMSERLRDMSKYSDEAILSMQTVLLTFKNIKGDTFEDASIAVLNLASKLGGDLQTNAIRVGKALQDPILGLTNLRRVGIQFSDAQTEMIKKLAKSGDMLGAQKIILTELESKFGGSAKAARTTLGGAIEYLRNRFNDLFELKPGGQINKITTAVNDLADTIKSDRMKSAMETIGTTFVDGVTKAAEFTQTLAEHIETVKNILLTIAGIKISSSVLALFGVSSGPAGVAVGTSLALYAAMDKSAAGTETLSERQGLGGNTMGTSSEISNMRTANAILVQELKRLEMQTSGTTSTGDKLKGTGYTKSPSGSGSGGKSAAEKLVENIKAQIQYAYAEGKNFLPLLDSWAAKLTPFSKDWIKINGLIKEINTASSKRVGIETAMAIQSNTVALTFAEQLTASKQVQTTLEAQKDAVDGIAKFWEGEAWGYSSGLVSSTDYLTELKDEFQSLSDELAGKGIDMSRWENWSDEMKKIFDAIQSVGGNIATESLQLLQNQFEKGTLTNAQYLSALEAIKVQFAEYPAVVKLADDAIKAFNLSAQTSLPTVASQLKAAWDDMNTAIANVPSSIGDAFVSAIKGSESLGDALKGLLQDIGAVIAKALILKALSGLWGGSSVTSVVTPGLSSLFGVTSAKGNIFDVNGLVPFANGGIVNKPTLFPFASGVGLMGEAGAEAIMPLKRTSSGDLGVQADGGGGMTNITMNINAVDSQSFIQMLRNNKAAVESLVIENIYRNGSVRKAIQQGV